MASGSKVAVANTSTYIQGCISWDATASGSGITVNVRFYMRRTNVYSGSTSSSDVSQYINISGNSAAWNYSQRGGLTVNGGQQNTWQGPYFSASRTFDVSRGGQTVYVGWKTVDNLNYGYLSGSGMTSFTLPVAYTAPTGVSGSNLTSNGNAGHAKSSVSCSSAGISSSVGWYIVSKTNSRGSEWTASQSSSTMEWDGVGYSTSTSSGVVTTWYPEILNNHSLYTFGSAKYISSPSAPTFSVSGSTGTSPKCTVTASVSYRGGETNSQYLNAINISKWRFVWYQGSRPAWDYTVNGGSSNSNTFTAFSVGNPGNYTIYSEVVNVYGGFSLGSGTLYAPTGVSGSASNATTTSFKVTASVTAKGGYNNTDNGTMACYMLKWSTNKSTVDNGGGTQIGWQTSNVFTISGLSPSTTYYYKIWAKNTISTYNTSGTLSTSTISRYRPELATPTVSAYSSGSSGMGVTISVKVNKTGGLTENGQPVTAAEAFWRKKGTSSWTSFGSIAGSWSAGSTMTFPSRDGAAPWEGDIEVYVYCRNGQGSEYDDDCSSPTATVTAPSPVTITAIRVANNYPTQIVVEGSTTSSNAVKKWELRNSNSLLRSNTTSSKSVQLLTNNHLEYNTTYTLFLRAYNVYGLWGNSGDKSQATGPRFSWHTSVNGQSKTVSAKYIKKGTSTQTDIKEVYYVVRDALGNLPIGTSLAGKRLKFISDPVWYRPENVASFTLSNGKEIAYKLDSSSDTYKFGIWNGNTLETTFFNGSSWVMSEYEFGNSNLTIVGANTSSIKNRAASLPNGYKQVEYLKSNGYQYIDSGVKMSNSTSSFEFDATFKYDTVHTGWAESTIFGAAYGLNNGEWAWNPQIHFSTSAEGTIVMEAPSSGHNNAVVTYGPTSDTKIHYVSGRVASNDTALTVDGTVYHPSTQSAISTWGPSCNIDIFSRNYQNQDTSTSQHVAHQNTYTSNNLLIYNLRFYQNGVLVGEYYPCVRTSDGKPGMYDLISNTFKPNLGTGEFTVGPDFNGNMNRSSLFSTTTCKEIPLWER